MKHVNFSAGLRGTDRVNRSIKLFVACASCCIVFNQAAWAEIKIDFGSDESEWAEDGECDDARFAGEGMTTTQLIAADIMLDASDCKSQLELDAIALQGISTIEFDEDDLEVGDPLSALIIDFGDDASEWANDGECDDMRFTGEGMTSTILIHADIMHDATDCEAAYKGTLINLVGIEFATEVKIEEIKLD